MPTPSARPPEPPSGSAPGAQQDPSSVGPAASGRSARDLVRDAARRLRAIEAGHPRLEAEYLLAAALGCKRIDLFRRSDGEPVAPEAAEAFASLLGRRLAREPLPYVLGTIPFGGCDLVIGPGALIPRGETEVLVEEVARRLARGRERRMPRKPAGVSEGTGPAPETPDSAGRAAQPPLLIDVGTGSGAILLALLARLPDWRGLGLDRSAAALRWAASNVKGAAAGPRTKEPAGPAASDPRFLLVRGDLLTAVRDGVAAAVVSNPPYIRSAEIASLAPEIRDHEPIEALDGGEDGLAVVRRLVPEAARVLVPGGLLALELAPDQPEAAARIARGTGAFEEPEVFFDLAGRRRGFVARKRAAW